MTIRTIRRADFEHEYARLELLRTRPILRHLMSVEAPYRPPTYFQTWAHVLGFVLFIVILIAAILLNGGALEPRLP